MLIRLDEEKAYEKRASFVSSQYTHMYVEWFHLKKENIDTNITDEQFHLPCMCNV